jgi:3-ketoacyl-CoA synthase
VDFARRVLEKSGLSRDGTYLPKNIHPGYCGPYPEISIPLAYNECKLAMTGAVEGLLRKTGLAAKEVDILITTCSLYCPTPSMASMLVNHFKMRSNIKSYHLGGMGCSNGVVAIDLINDILQVRVKVRSE